MLHDVLGLHSNNLRKAFDALPKGGAVVVYDAIIDDDRREKRFRIHDELEYADRNCRWVRLYRRRLSGLDARSRIFKNAGRTACWPGFDGDRIKVAYPGARLADQIRHMLQCREVR